MNDQINEEYESFGFNCRCYFYQNHPTRTYYRFLCRWKWSFLIVMLILLHCCNHPGKKDLNLFKTLKKIKPIRVMDLNPFGGDVTEVRLFYSNYSGVKNRRMEFYEDLDVSNDLNHSYYKYQLANSTETITMNCGNTVTYDWFMTHIRRFKNLGLIETLTYTKEVPICKLSMSSLGPINVSKEERKLYAVEKEYPHVKHGGYYSPPHCRPRHRVAILVPYRNREKNLAIFLHYIHPLLKKQLLEYRIFVIEQFGSEEFNKGALYNVGFLESQRFGIWQCLVFHDVDLIPQDERILYSCPRKPTHLSTAVESQNYQLPYLQLFGGVTALTTKQYEAVNGYSNLYLNWGAEDDDMYRRVQAKRFPILRYNSSIARYVALPHVRNSEGQYRYTSLYFAKQRFRREGLNSLRYRLINVTKRRLYTRILVNVNPFRLNITSHKIWREYIFSFIKSK